MSAPRRNQLEGLVAEALANHPRTAVPWLRAAQAGDRYRQHYGFFDPSLRVAGGASDDIHAVPGMADFGSLSAEAYALQGSLDIPVRPGFYVSMGLTERYLRDPDTFDNLYQTVAGAALRVPLLKDRGFALWDIDRKIRLADFDRLLSECLAERQALRHDVEQAYVAVCENQGFLEVSKEAADRNQALVKEAEGLAGHDALAEYQVFAAQAELGLSKTDYLGIRQQVETSLLTLTELLAREETVAVTADPENWLIKAAETVERPKYELADGLRNRGDYLAVLNERLKAELGAERAEEALQGDLSLVGGATWRTEDENQPGGVTDTREDRAGGHIMLIYKRPLGFRSEKSQWAEQRNRLAELDALARQIELRVKRDLDTSRKRLSFAGERLAEATRAMMFAEKNLQAEQERFRLGEARSRHVLDAQKDVTTARRARVSAAADLARAWSDHAFAAGYPDTRLVHMDTKTIKPDSF
ncbi:MAG: TolC family protein [Lentisphaeria bacterium]|nr:TolC family protein [Lentisphaeria bacterium]